MADALIIQVDSSQVEKGKRSLADLASQGAKTESAIGGLGRTGKASSDSIASLATGARTAAIGIAAVGAGILALGSTLLRTQIGVEKLNNTLKFSTGSAEGAAREIEYLKTTANALGLEFETTATAYAKFSAAAKGTTLEGQKTRDIFESIAKASTVLGLSADETGGALKAIEQIISKGTVSSEELRGQLGERLPGAFQIAARAMGVTTQALGKMLEQGEVVSDVFLPKFAAELTKTLGDSPDSAAGSAQAQLNKLSNAWLDFKKTVADTGIVTISLNVIEGTTNALKWFEHFVFGKGELADIQKRLNKQANLTLLQNRIDTRVPESSLFETDRTKQARLNTFNTAQAKDKAELFRLKRELGLINEKQFNPASGNSSPSLLAPNFGVTKKAGEGGYDARVNNQKQIDSAARGFNDAKQKADQLRKHKEDNENKLYALQRELEKDIEEREVKHLKLVRENNLSLAKDKEALENKHYELANDLEKSLEDRELKHQKLIRGIKEDAAKDQLKAQQDLAKDINKSLTDALLRGFESGKGFAKNFRDTLINMFKTLVLQPTISAILKPLTDGVSGILSGGVGSLLGGGKTATNGGIFGSASNLLSVGKSIYSGFSSSLSSNIGGLVAKLAPKLGSSIAGSMLGSAAGLGPTVAGAATGIGSLTGGVGALGSAIGTALPIVGLAIAAFSLIKSLSKKNSYQNGNFTSSFQDGALTQTGAVTNSRGALATGALPAINEVTETFAARLSILFNEFGLSNKQIFRTQIKFGKQLEASFGSASQAGGGAAVDGYGGNNYGSDAQAGMARFVSDILGKGLQGAITTSSLSGGIKKFFTSLTKQEDVLDAITSIVSLNRQLGDLPKVFNAIRNAIDTTSYQTSIADLKTRFAAIGTYTSLFYSAEEQFATFTKQLNTQLSALGAGLPSSRDEYRKLVDGINVTDEATSGLFNGLVALAPAMDAYFKQLEEQQAQVNALAKSMDSLRTEQFFKTLFDFKRYTGVADNYGSDFANNYVDKIYTSRKLPSFATGADMLPNDMVAQVHAGERIVPAADNKAIIQSLNGGGDLKQLIRDLIIEVRSGNISMVQAAQKTAKVMQRIDDEGVMINETNNAGVRTVLNVRTVA